MGGNPIGRVDPLGLAGMTVEFAGYQVSTGAGFTLGLGHSGAIAIDDNSGDAFYFDFGRFGADYDPIFDGKYGSIRGPDKLGKLKFGDDGCSSCPDEASLDILRALSQKYGHGYPVHIN